jgi:hypothetical protein
MSTDLDDGALIGIESAEEELEIAKVHDYFVTVTGGLEDVALREIKSTLKGVSQIHVNKRQRQGRIHFRYERSPKRLLELKTVEGVFALLRIFRGVTTGRPGLIRIAEEISTLDLGPTQHSPRCPGNCRSSDQLHGRQGAPILVERTPSGSEDRSSCNL